MVAGTETFSRNGGHVGLAQEFPSQIGGRFHPTASKECRDIWICVERPFRQRAFNSGNGTQAFYNMIAQPNVLLAHFFDALLRTVQGCDRCLLHDGSRIRRRLALQLLHRVHDRRGRERVSQSPAGHRVGFRERADDHHTLAIFA